MSAVLRLREGRGSLGALSHCPSSDGERTAHVMLHLGDCVLSAGKSRWHLGCAEAPCGHGGEPDSQEFPDTDSKIGLSLEHLQESNGKSQIWDFLGHVRYGTVSCRQLNTSVVPLLCTESELT